MSTLISILYDWFLIILGIGLVGGILAGIVALVILAWGKINDKEV